MAKKKTETISDKIKEVVNQIQANSKDAKFAKKLTSRLVDLQKQADVQAVEICVPSTTVTDEIDFGSTKIQRTAQGFLFTAKGGLQTLISWRMNAVCQMIQWLFDWKETPTDDEEEKKVREAHTSAVLYLMQAPLFGAIGQTQLFEIATHILSVFNAYAEEHKDVEPSEETEADIKANIEAEREQEVIDRMVEEAENLPQYEDE
jgi:hypothetical protein